jgi:hypothetical protein
MKEPRLMGPVVNPARKERRGPFTGPSQIGARALPKEAIPRLFS